MSPTATEGPVTGLAGAELIVADDRLSVTLRCTAELVQRPDVVQLIKAELNSRHITAPPNDASLRDALSSASPDKYGQINVVIVRGTPPQPPTDATLAWSADYFTSGPYIDPVTRRVDYRRQSATAAVVKDELMAVVHPPKPGVSGVDVFGRDIRVPLPRPCQLRAGRNAVWDSGVNGFRAQCAGRVRLKGQLIEVLDTYHIAGDVGPETGHVDHGGSVMIAGSVVSEYRVRAGGDVEIAEVVGAADIECGGNLVVRKGISSRVGKCIHVGEQLCARYVENAVIRSEGDVVVESEILNSSIHTAGRLICPGKVIGGDIMAAAGIQIGEAGSKEETMTTLIAGIDYRAAAELRAAVQRTAKIKEGMEQWEIAYKQLAKLGTAVTPQQREQQTELLFQLSEAKEELEQVADQRRQLAEKLSAHRDATIIIERRAYPGTILRVLESQREVTGTPAPLSARLDSRTNELVLSAVTG